MRSLYRKVLPLLLTCALIVSQMSVFPGTMVNADEQPQGIYNAAFQKPVTTNGTIVNEANLNILTDGVRDRQFYVLIDVNDGPKWCQVDLESELPVVSINLVNDYNPDTPRTGRDIIIQLSNDPDFAVDVTTVFNNDADNSAGQGIGTDEEYEEPTDGSGKTVTLETPVFARYVRVWSWGHLRVGETEYRMYNTPVEIEVYVDPSLIPSPSPGESGEPSPGPTAEPTPSPEPSAEPDQSPEPTPSVEPTPSAEPTPSVEPTPSAEPTPSVEPSPSVGPSPSGPKVLQVGPGKEYSKLQDAINAANPGDIIEIDASGVYYGSDANTTVNKNDIIIRGVNGRAKMEAIPGERVTARKGIWVVTGNNVTVENIEFTGAQDNEDNEYDDRNWAGIRVEGTNLTIRNCYFHHNDNGILTYNDANAVITIENSEFSHNGYVRADGHTHNLYIGKINKLIFRYNYTHDAKQGHLLKTRAENGVIEYNCMLDLDGGLYASSSNIDMPNAGTYYVIGNVFRQSDGNNWRMLSYGVEGASNTGKELYVINNTFVNEVPEDDATFIQVQPDASLSVIAKNNIFTGKGAIFRDRNGVIISAAVDEANLKNVDPYYADRANYDYHLTSRSWIAVDKGVDPGVSSEGYPLTPVKEYVHLCSSVDRTVVGAAIDIGAFEFTGTIVPESSRFSVSVEPGFVEQGQQVTVTIKAAEAIDLYAFDFTFTYNPAVFELVSAGLCDSAAGFQLLSDISDAAGTGTIDILATLTGNVPGISGADVDLVRFVFRPKAERGKSEFTLLGTGTSCDSDARVYALGEDIGGSAGILNCDINGDGYIRLDDLVLVAKAFGTKEGDAGYNALLDINYDGEINIVDLTYIALKLLI